MRDRWDTTRTDLAGMPAAESDPPKARGDSVLRIACQQWVTNVPSTVRRAERVTFAPILDGHPRVRREISRRSEFVGSPGPARPSRATSASRALSGANGPRVSRLGDQPLDDRRVDEAFDGGRWGECVDQDRAVGQVVV